MDLFKLGGKKALVVGGGLGIGRATARLLSGAGASVAVLDMDLATWSEPRPCQLNYAHRAVSRARSART